MKYEKMKEVEKVEKKGKFTDWPMDHSMSHGKDKMHKCSQDKRMMEDANISKHKVFLTKD